VKKKSILVLVASALIVVPSTPVLACAAGVPGIGALEPGRVRTENVSLRGTERSEKDRELLNTLAAKRVLEHCRRLGIRELREEAFRLPGGAGRGQSGYFVIPMENPGGDRFGTALLVRESDEAVVAITVDTATGELVQTISPGGEEELVSFDKKKWSDCFAVSCSVCVAGCAFTGPLWLKCMAACCGVSAATCAAIALQE